MLGTLRFTLALLVAISHAGISWGGLNPGVIAVVGFYAISGYVMTALMRRHYTGLNCIPAFYADRALRLLPAYYAVMLLTLAWLVWHGPVTPYLERIPTLTDFANNLLVVPLNYYMWNSSDRLTLIPPAWSLGCEIQFYLLFPFILLLRLRSHALVISFVVYLLAFTGRINTDWFGYRLLPGTLFIFLLGSWLSDLHSRGRGAGLLAWSVSLVAFGLALWGGRMDLLNAPFNRETLAGLALALPLLHLLAPRTRRDWDDQVGDLSYGVFLSHFLIYWMWPGAESGKAALALRLLAVLVVAWGLNRLIERPALNWRRRLRNVK